MGFSLSVQKYSYSLYNSLYELKLSFFLSFDRAIFVRHEITC